jgi:hypothetical protein
VAIFFGIIAKNELMPIRLTIHCMIVKKPPVKGGFLL